MKRRSGGTVIGMCELYIVVNIETTLEAPMMDLLDITQDPGRLK